MQPFVYADREDALAGAGIVGIALKVKMARLFRLVCVLVLTVGPDYVLPRKTEHLWTIPDPNEP
jgi:hypothetical protein